MEAAEEALRQCQWDVATGHFLSALREHPRLVRALQRLYARGKGTQDRKLFADVLACAPRPTGHIACDLIYAKIARTLGSAVDADAFRQSAESNLRDLVARDPADWNNRQELGNLFRDFADSRGTLVESLKYLDEAYANAPDDAKVGILNDRAMTRRCLGDRGRAEEEFTRVLGWRPDHAKARTNRSLLLLLRGEYEPGLADYEWRRSGSRAEGCDRARWQGKRVLVWWEQGAGDQIQMVRFVRAVREAASHVTLVCEQGLVDLFADNTIAQAITGRWKDMEQKDVPGHDVSLPVMSLPFALGVRYEHLPWAPIPYLTSRPARLPEPVGELLSRNPAKALRIGLAWAGNPFLPNDHLRSCPLSAFEPLVGIPGTAWCSLQVGLRQGDKERIGNLPLLDLGAHLHSYAATAAAIAELDVVVAVDTSVAHVAGAIGKDVAVAIPYDPDWRWWQEGSATRWYTNATVFRQREIGEWGPVMGDLEGWIRDHVRRKLGGG